MKKAKIYISNAAEAGDLREEVRTLRRNLKKILKHHDEWVLIKGKVVVGFFKSFAEGITVGYNRFGLKKFMMAEVNRLTKPLLM